MSLLKKDRKDQDNIIPITEKSDLQAYKTKMAMLDNALLFMANYDELAAAIHEKGPENIMQCLAVLEPNQITAITRGLMKSMTREVYNELAIIYREQELAVTNGGVDSQEISFSEFITDYVAREFEDDTPIAILKEKALHELYQTLQQAFLVAEKAQFGLRPGYELQGLPFYYYQADGENGPWINIWTAEEAFTTIAREREAYKAAQQVIRNSKIAELKNLKIA